MKIGYAVCLIVFSLFVSNMNNLELKENERTDKEKILDELLKGCAEIYHEYNGDYENPIIFYWVNKNYDLCFKFYSITLIFRIANDGTLLLVSEQHQDYSNNINFSLGEPSFKILLAVSRLHNTCFEEKRKVDKKDLENLVKFSKYDQNYRERQAEEICTQVKNLGYVDKCDILICRLDKYYSDILYSMTFYIGKCELQFSIFNNSDHVKIVHEIYNCPLNSDKRMLIIHDKVVGYLSTDIFCIILDLFKTCGKHADMDNADIVTLFESYKNMNTKSSRTIL